MSRAIDHAIKLIKCRSNLILLYMTLYYRIIPTYIIKSITSIKYKIDHEFLIK